ncbi:MAG: tetratricopeptide repeat protein [Planctomycetota bacterium]
MDDAGHLIHDTIEHATAGRMDEARRCADRAVELAPLDPAAWEVRAELYAFLDELEVAEECYAQLSALRPLDRRGFAGRADALERLGRGEDALAAWEEACARGPDFPDPWLRRAQLLQVLGRREESLAAIEHALTLAPAERDAHRLRAGLLRLQGRTDEAERALRRALRISRHHEPTRADLAELLDETGRAEEAAALRPLPPLPLGELIQLTGRHHSGRPISLRYLRGPLIDEPRFQLPVSGDDMDRVAHQLLDEAAQVDPSYSLLVGLVEVCVLPWGEELALHGPDLDEGGNPFDEVVPLVGAAIRIHAALEALHTRLGIPAQPACLFDRVSVDLQAAIWAQRVEVLRVCPEHEHDSGLRVFSASVERARALRRLRSLERSSPPLCALVSTQPRLLQACALPIGWSAVLRGPEVVSVRDAAGEEQLARPPRPQRGGRRRRRAG